MPINQTDPLNTLTNAQCAALRDDLVALLVASGITDPTVRNLRRRVKIGIDYMEDRKDERAEQDAADLDNQRRREHEDRIRPIQARRAARAQADYGPD